MYTKLKSKFKTLYWTFFHNELANTNYIADTILDPVYRIFEQIAKRAGPIFVALVVLLTSSVVVLYYLYILPWIRVHWSPTLATVNYIFGHWLLLNIVFNYIMAVKTPPGRPPPNFDSPVSICKSCVSPKPPRTHHCSVCKRCVLKMDHHCPWLNNCVGHFNHRYFYLFCVYMTLGTIFVSLSIYQQLCTFFTGSPIRFLVSIATPAFSIIRAWISSNQLESTPSPSDPHLTAAPNLKVVHTEEYLQTQFWVSYEFFLCVGVTIALGSLVVFHTRLISRGETSIEKHINNKERRRVNELGKTYRNPYHFGFTRNWRMFFGIEEGTGRSWRHVLLPSTHKPTGDGTAWKTFSATAKCD